MRAAAVTLFALWALFATAAAADARTWTSAGGQHTIEGDLVEVVDGRAVLKQADGRHFLVEIDKLSVADKAHLKQLGLFDGDPGVVAPMPPIGQPPIGQPPVGPKTPEASPAVPPGEDLTKRLFYGVVAPFRNQDMQNAKKILDNMANFRLDGPTKEEVRFSQEVYGKLDVFWKAFRDGVAKLQAGGEIPVGEERLLVVEADAEQLIVRAFGRNCRFQLDAPPTIPAKLVLAVIDRTTRKTPELTEAIDLFRQLNSVANDKSRWQIAAGPGPNVPFESLLDSATPPRPGDPRPVPPSEKPVLPAPPTQRLALPSAADRDKARNEVRELFKKELEAAKNGQQKNDLAREFSKLAHETYPKEPATCFALIQEALEMTSSTGNAPATMLLVDWLATRYAIDDPLRAKILYLGKATKGVPPATGRYVGEQGLELMEEAAKAGKFDVLDSLAAMTSLAARQGGEKELADKIIARKQALAQLQAASGEVDALKKTLATTPDDPAANEKLGLILACVQEDWAAGLPHLAKSGDANLSAAAKRDAANPTDANAKVAAADAWWTLAEAGTHAAHATALKARAVYWYQEALPGLNGLAKLKAEKRIKGE